MVDFRLTLPTTSKHCNILTTYWLSEIILKGPGIDLNTLITICNSITCGDAGGGNCMVTGDDPATKYAPYPVLEPSVKISGASSKGCFEVTGEKNHRMSFNQL